MRSSRSERDMGQVSLSLVHHTGVWRIFRRSGHRFADKNMRHAGASVSAHLDSNRQNRAWTAVRRGGITPPDSGHVMAEKTSTTDSSPKSNPKSTPDSGSKTSPKTGAKTGAKADSPKA